METIQYMQEIRQRIIDIYSSIPDEYIKDLESRKDRKECKTFLEEHESIIQPLKEEIRKNIFRLLCQGYFTDTVEGDDVYTKIIFTDEEIEEMYQIPYDRFQTPLMRSYGGDVQYDPIMGMYPHPKSISLTPEMNHGFGVWNSFMPKKEEDFDEKKYRIHRLLYSRLHLNSFLYLYLHLWNIGIDANTGDIEILVPQEREYRNVLKYLSLFSKLSNIERFVRELVFEEDMEKFKSLSKK